MLCTSPSKTFNLAGLQVSNIFIPNEDIRNRFQNELWNTGYSLINTMGLVACKSAYQKGKPWLDELRVYLNKEYSAKLHGKSLADVSLALEAIKSMTHSELIDITEEQFGKDDILDDNEK